MITNKNIVITGASSGIGFETLKRLAKGKGNRILAVARKPEKLEGYAKNVIPFSADVSTQAGVDAIFEKAAELFGRIDIFFANAGFPYYEVYDYVDWDRVDKIFRTNMLSPIYTYSKYIEHIGDAEGQLAMTISAMGQMAMPGYALYGATKFGLEGFRQGIRLEMPKNLSLTCLYPVSTATNFFKVAADGRKVDKPFPVQKPEVVARKMVRALEKGKENVYPCNMFVFAKLLMGHIPPVRGIYWGMERKKLERHLEKQGKKLKIK